MNIYKSFIRDSYASEWLSPVDKCKGNESRNDKKKLLPNQKQQKDQEVGVLLRSCANFLLPVIGCVLNDVKKKNSNKYSCGFKSYCSVTI